MSVKCIKSKNQRGIGLLELMLSLSIIAILLVMATRYYGVTKASQQLNDGLSMVTGVMSGGAKYYLAKGNTYSDISISNLYSSGFIPGSFCGSGSTSSCTGAGANPWGGDLTVAPGTGNNYTIKLASLPSNVCTSLQDMINSSIKNTNNGNNSNAACNSNILTVIVY